MNDGLMTWTPTLTTVEPFVGEIVERFQLGARRDVAVTAMIGSANRLWRFDVRLESFVVKELSHEGVESSEMLSPSRVSGSSRTPTTSHRTRSRSQKGSQCSTGTSVATAILGSKQSSLRCDGP
jgi:hypothetical protein